MIQTMATGAPGRCYDCAQRTDEPRYCARCAKAHDWNRDTHPAPPVRDAVPRECMYCERVFDAPHGLVSTCYVRHACNFLRPGGRLVAVMSAGTAFRENRKAVEFRALVDGCGGSLEPLPENTFAAAGTGVRTVLVAMGKP